MLITQLHRLRHVTFHALLFITLVAMVGLNRTEANEIPKKIKVAIAQSNIPYHFVNEKNEADGLAVDIWKEWQLHTGIEVEFVSGNWPESIEAVKSGKADIHAGLAYSPERTEELAFGDGLYSVSSNLYVHKNIVGISSFEQVTPFVVGVIRNAAYTHLLLSKNPKAKLKYYDSRRELLEGVARGEVNTFVELDYMSMQFQGFKEVAEAYPVYKSLMLADLELKVAVQKDNAQWLNVINEGLAKISPQKVAELEGRWLRTDSNPSALRLAFSAGNEPYMSVNLAGQPTGLFIDLWQKWADKNGVKIEFVPNNMQLSLQALLQGKADIHIAYPESETVNTGLSTLR